MHVFFLAAHTLCRSLFFSPSHPPSPSTPLSLSLSLSAYTLVCQTHTHTHTHTHGRTHTWPERISSAFKLCSRFLCLSLLLPLFQWGAAATRVGVGRVPTLISTGVLLGVSHSAPPSSLPLFVCPHSLFLTLSALYPPPHVLHFTKYFSCALLLYLFHFIYQNDHN